MLRRERKNSNTTTLNLGVSPGGPARPTPPPAFTATSPHILTDRPDQLTSAPPPALLKVGVLPTRENGMHAIRHFYASVLLDAGESVRGLASYLGHADPGFTLRVYTHLMPASEERTKRAIDKVLD